MGRRPLAGTPRGTGQGGTHAAPRSPAAIALSHAAQKGQGRCRPRTDDGMDPPSQPEQLAKGHPDFRSRLVRRHRFGREPRLHIERRAARPGGRHDRDVRRTAGGHHPREGIGFGRRFGGQGLSHRRGLQGRGTRREARHRHGNEARTQHPQRRGHPGEPRLFVARGTGRKTLSVPQAVDVMQCSAVRSGAVWCGLVRYAAAQYSSMDYDSTEQNGTGGNHDGSATNLGCNNPQCDSYSTRALHSFSKRKENERE
mmetsp:Transcript_6218/g.15439  ORF Transcript_6218/g.15439 Transcript_6218/m.15439 type:complete len:255 (-) Transcript_6218:25-789(-)